MKKEHIQLLFIGFLMGTTPFFLNASDLTDFSEVKSAAAGAGAIAVLGALKWIFTAHE